MIEVEKKDLFKFLIYDSKDNKEGKNICIFQNQKGRSASFSVGKIEKIENFNIKYNSRIKHGCSESVIVNSDNFKILGVNRFSIDNSNAGALIKFANDRFLKTIKKEIIYDFMNVKDIKPNSIFYKKIKLLNGDEYEGELTKDNIKEGYGWCKSADNYIYIGEYKNDKRNGYGTLLRIDGEYEIKEYEGYWKDDDVIGKDEHNIYKNRSIIKESVNNKKQRDGKIKDRILEIKEKLKKDAKKMNEIDKKNCRIIDNGIILRIIILILIIYIILRDTSFLKDIHLINFCKEYHGTYNKYFQKDGKGTCIYSGNNKYVGEWKNGKMEGHGVLIYYNGDKYDGEWKNNMMDHGIYIWADGDKYEGKFKNYLFEGHGIFTKVDGNKYIGEWKNGLREGFGVFTFSNGDEYNGEFQNDKIEGYGIYIWSDGAKYDGEWKNDKMEGHGIFSYSNGDKYEGEFKNGVSEGNGIFTKANGEVDNNDKFNNRVGEGRSVFIWDSGDKYII